MEELKNMMNQMIMVGRLTRETEFKEENGEKVAILSIAVPRSYKNKDGIYETDFIDFVARGTIGEHVAEYCEKGDILGIKGHAESKKQEDNNYKIELIADKVTFLSSRKEEIEEV